MFVPIKAHADSETKVLFFYHEGCPWCAKMDGILRDPEMVSLLSGHAQLIKINVESRQKIASLQQSGIDAARKFKVYGTPTIIFMAAGKNELLRIPANSGDTILIYWLMTDKITTLNCMARIARVVAPGIPHHNNTTQKPEDRNIFFQ